MILLWVNSASVQVILYPLYTPLSLGFKGLKSVNGFGIKSIRYVTFSGPCLAHMWCVFLQDQGISVRKRAVKTLWDCVRCPGFQRTVEGMVVILHRAGDQEESMRTLVTKICSAMWFTPGLVVGKLDSGGGIAPQILHIWSG
jgi:hypothetical protein